MEEFDKTEETLTTTCCCYTSVKNVAHETKTIKDATEDQDEIPNNAHKYNMADAYLVRAIFIHNYS